MLGAESARSRAHPDPQRDVWELGVWDPLPVCLRLFCLFSPGHVLVYWLFLPTTQADPRPSTTVVTTTFLAVLLSVQLSLLQTGFSQQSKDLAMISKEVFNEYDTKYVHPRTQPMYRDIATQFTEQASYNTSRDERYNVVETYTPMVVINPGFKTNPNPNYVAHTDPDGSTQRPSQGRKQPSTPSTNPAKQTLRTPSQLVDSSSPLRPNTAIRQPNFRSGVTDGGSLGVYSHVASPLRKSTSIHSDLQSDYSNNYSRERSNLSPEKRQLSPDKRMSVPTSGMNTLAAAQRWGHLKPSSIRRESGTF